MPSPRLDSQHVRRAKCAALCLAALPLAACRDLDWESLRLVNVAHGQSRDAGAATNPASALADVARNIPLLRDPSASVRESAAAHLRQLFQSSPGLAGDGANWRLRLSRFPPGTPIAVFEHGTGATSDGSMGGNGGSTTRYQLDDFWAVTVYTDRSARIRTVGALEQATRRVWVDPPAHFTGRWVTYFANGVVANDIEYTDGVYVHFTARHDNGQIAYEQRYVHGQIVGPETGFDRDGHRLYAITHAMGQNVGHWVHWFPNGHVQSEETYVAGQQEGTSTNWREDGSRSNEFDYLHGQETGQAAWDEHGVLLYAHGTAEQRLTRDH